MTEINTRTQTGLVVSSKRDKTITVMVERKIKHPLYKKILRRSSKLQAHDQDNACNEGDLVTIPLGFRIRPSDKLYKIVENKVEA